MAFHSRQTLETWLTEFHALGYPTDGTFRVIEQDGADGANTGLVAVRLSSGLRAYLQPDNRGRWVTTIESSETAFDLEPASVSRLSAELATVSALCAFLQATSIAVRV